MGVLRSFFILLFLFSFVKADFPLYYYNNTDNLENVLELPNEKFTLIETKKNLGTKKDVWLKTILDNKENEIVKQYMALSKIHFMNEVTFYTLKDGKIVHRTPTYQRESYNQIPNHVGNTLFYENNLDPLSSVDIYIHIRAKSHIYYELRIGSMYEIGAELYENSLIVLVMLSVLVAFGVYYLFLFLLTPNREYGYYTLFIVSLFISSMYLYGGFASYFNLFSAYKFSLAFTILIPFFTILFLQTIYKNEKEFQKYNKILNFALTVLAITLILYILGRLGLIPYISIKYYTTYIFPLQYIIVMYVAISIYRKKLPFSGLFMLSYSGNFFGSLTTTLFFIGVTPYHFLTLYANVIGGLMEAVLFSTLLTYKVKVLYKNRDEAELQAKTQKIQLNIMEKIIGFIEHQWRQPLSYINGSVMKIDNSLYTNKIKIEEIDKELELIETSTAYMSETINDFSKLLYSQQGEKYFELQEMMNQSLLILEKDLQDNGVKVEVQKSEECRVSGVMSEVLQVFMIIVINAIEIFKRRNILDPKITLQTYKVKNDVYIKIQDNGGGIKAENTDDIFEAYYSSKSKGSKSGLGLHIAKLFVEFKMQGKISAYNKDNGACFVIVLKGYNESK